MIPCDRPLETLSAFVDGELGVQEELEIRRHLDGCPICARRVATLEAMKGAVARTAEIHPVPHALKESLRVPKLDGRRQGYRLAGLVAAGSVFVLVVLFAWSRLAPRASVTEQLISDHSRYAATGSPAEYATSDRERLARWFSERVGFSVSLPALADARVTGGRRCTIAGRKAALAFYERGKHRMSVFVMPAGTLPAAERERLRKEAAGEAGDCLDFSGGYRLCFSTSGDTEVVTIETRGNA